MKPFFYKIVVTIAVLCAVILIIETASYVIFAYRLDPSIRDQVEFAVNPENKIKELRWVPNSLWHHDLPESILNNHKTIGPDFVMPKPADTYRILCLGDSTSQFAGHHPELLQQKLANAYYQGKRIEVINAGVGSHCSAFTLSYFALRLIHFNPDLVILKVGYNDYVPFTHADLDYDYSCGFPRPYTIDAGDRRYWKAARHSYLLKLIGVFALDLPGKDFYAYPDMYDISTLSLMSNADKIYLYTENIRSIISLCRARGIKITILDLPVAPKAVEGFSSFEYRPFIRYMDSKLKEVADISSVDYLETKTLLDADDFKDHCHLHPSGGGKIADQVIKKYHFNADPPA